MALASCKLYYIDSTGAKLILITVRQLELGQLDKNSVTNDDHQWLTEPS